MKNKKRSARRSPSRKTGQCGALGVAQGSAIPAIQSAALNIGTAARDADNALECWDEEKWEDAVMWINNAIAQLESARAKIMTHDGGVNCEHYRPTPPDPRYAVFGKLMWGMIQKMGGDFCGDAWSEEVLPLAEKAGLCARVKYDPEKHGYIEDAEPGHDIWWWGDDISNDQGEAQPPAKNL